MMTLVHHKCITGDRFGVELIGIEKVDKFGLRRCGLLRGHKTDVVRGGPRCNLRRVILIKSLRPIRRQGHTR